MGVFKVFLGAGAAEANTLNFAIGNSEALPSTGSWLVRPSTSIPEPTVLFLLATGLAGLGLTHVSRPSGRSRATRRVKKRSP